MDDFDDNEVKDSWVRAIELAKSKLTDNHIVTGYFQVLTTYNQETDTPEVLVFYKSMDQANLLGNIELAKLQFQDSIMGSYEGEDKEEVENTLQLSKEGPNGEKLH